MRIDSKIKMRLPCRREVSPGVVLDYNETNEVVGVEMLHLSKRSPTLKPIRLGIRNGLTAGEMVGGLLYHNYPSGSGLSAGMVFGHLAGSSAGRDAMALKD